MKEAELKNQIKKEVEEFINKLSFEGEAEVEIEKETIKINVKSSEAKLLIGEGGTILLSLQHLLRKILRKKFCQDKIFDLDINEYKRKKENYLKELANTVADEVALTKKPKELEPMPAYQRRIIHLELAKRNDVTTESIGEEPNRRVVIKPVSAQL